MLQQKTVILFLQLFFVSTICIGQNKIFLATDGEITFRSDAQQELIKASSHDLRGALDVASKTFTFKVRVSTFSGFNSNLQQTHFNENYLQSERFPEATFKGKIIEEVDWNVPAKLTVRAKGILSIHGVDQERIIKGVIIITPDNKVKIESFFSILLSDHNIPIPRIVKEKLSEEISVAIRATLVQRN
jgi:YceI-like domain